MYYPVSENRICLNFNNATNNDSGRNLVNGNKVHAEYFLNFGFPGTPDNSPGSVNGRKFVVPTSPLLTQSKEKYDVCDEELCKQNGICECTHIQNLEPNKLIQMTLLNLGNGTGASHPIHVHGHTYHVMKVGLATYNETTGELISNNKDIACTDDFNYCSSADWENNGWSGGNIPDMNAFPPLKDTIIVPTGGYVVIRFVSDNPGIWFMHCHIDMHQMAGMAIVLDELGNWPKPAYGFPKCQNFLNERGQEESAASNDHTNAIIGGGVGGVAAVILIAAVVIVIYMKTCRTVNGGNHEPPAAVQMSELSPQ